MNAFCPNLNNEQVRQEFNELVDVFGEDTAYFLWNANNGYSIDSAPNGAPSILYNSILQYKNNNRKEALKEKAKVYTKHFKDIFGDWINDPLNSSKAVDINGEPMILWHGTDSVFTEFSTSEDNVRTLPIIHDSNAIFFTDRQDKAFKYRHSITIPAYLNMRNPAVSSVEDGTLNSIEEYTLRENDLIADDQYDSAFFTRYDREGDENGKIPTKLYVVKRPELVIRIDLEDKFPLYKLHIYHNRTPYSIVDYWNKLLENPYTRVKDLKKFANNLSERFGVHVGMYPGLNRGLWFLRKPSIKQEDKIQRTNNADQASVEKVVLYLMHKFPLLRARWVNDSEWEFGSSNAAVQGNVIYLRRGVTTTELAAEEMLHTLVYTLHRLNQELFNNLLEQAKIDFPTLYKEILAAYNENLNREEELVTQTLSRYFIKNSQLSITNKFKGIVLSVINWFDDLFTEMPVFNELFKKYVAKVSKLKTTVKFEDIVSLLVADDLQFEVEYMNYAQTRYNLLFLSSTTAYADIYELAEHINSDRQLYAKNVADNYKLANKSKFSSTELTNRAAQVYSKSIEAYNRDHLKQEVDKQIRHIADVNNIKLVNGAYIPSTDKLSDRTLAMMLNSMSEDTFKNYIQTLTPEKLKYIPTNYVSDPNSFNTVLYESLRKGDLNTIQDSMLRDYIRMFWASDLIQETLAKIDNNRGLTSQLLEDELVKAVIDNENSSVDNVSEFILNFFGDITEVNKNTLDAKKLSLEDLFTSIESAFLMNEDLLNTSTANIIYDMADGNFDTSNMLDQHDKDVLKSLHDGLKVRLKSQTARSIKNNKLIVDLRNRLEVFENEDDSTIDSTYNLILEFLEKAIDEIHKTKVFLDTLQLKPLEQWNADLVNNVYYDMLGYYENLITQVFDLFNDDTSATAKFNMLRLLNDPYAIDLKHLSSLLKNELDAIISDYNTKIAVPYVKYILDEYIDNARDISDKPKFKRTMHMFLELNSKYGDLATGEVLIGMASRSKSSIVRIVELMMSLLEFLTDREVLHTGKRLMRVYNKCRPFGSKLSPINYLKQLIEFDRDGVPTGYFLRPINYGLFYKDKDLFILNLVDKYNLTVDDEGQPIFPEEDKKDDNSIYNKFNDELDDWLEEHCERRYKSEYYKKRRRFLSLETITEVNQINRLILLLLQQGVDKETGIFLETNLEPALRRQLETLRKQRRDLSSPYIFHQDSNGILIMEHKSGKALKIAEELESWNIYLSDKVSYKTDWKKFNADFLKIKTVYGDNSKEALDFYNNNVVMKLTPEFYNLLKQTSNTNVSEELLKLLRRHSSIMALLKHGELYQLPNLKLLGDGIGTNTDVWRELNSIETKISLIKAKLVKNAEDRGIKFLDVAVMLLVLYDQNTTLILHLIDRWKNPIALNVSLAQEFASLFTYTDERGKLKYLNVFNYLAPAQSTMQINGKNVKMIDLLPISKYNTLDELSLYVNNKYDTASNEIMLPKTSGKYNYTNKAYDKIKGTPTEELLNEVLAIMDEANSVIPQGSINRSHVMPLITGRKLAILGSTILNKELLHSIGYTITSWANGKYLEQDPNVDTNADISRRPDGSAVNNIPIRYVKRLNNPAYISTDVIGSVMLFYEMAMNYKNKSSNLSQLELIKRVIAPSINSSNAKMLLPEQYKKVSNLLSQRYYGKESTFSFNEDEKLTSSKRSVMQATKKVRNIASVAMLGLNTFTIAVGYLDALSSMLADSVGGKYLTPSDFKYGLGISATHTFRMLSNLGNPMVKDKLVALMLYNQLSRSNSELFSRSDQYRGSKVIGQGLLMGGYTISDYMINAALLVSTYHHYRLVKNPATNKDVFLSLSEIINLYTQHGYTEKEAVKAWRKAKITLYDAYELKDTEAVVKEKYKQLVTKDLENRIRGRVADRAAVYNGVIPATEKAKLQLNVWGSYITLMRNFYVNTYWDRFNTGIDYKADDDKRVTWASEYTRDDYGFENLETGEFTGAHFKDFMRGMYKLTMYWRNFFVSNEKYKLTRELKVAVRRGVTELAMITAGIMMSIWSTCLLYKTISDDDDDDKKPAWTINIVNPVDKGGNKIDKPLVEFNTDNIDRKLYRYGISSLALLSVRYATERSTSWWAPTTLDIIKSPTTATSYFDKIGTIYDVGLDLLNPEKSSEVIRSGGYKGMTRGTRDILKVLSATGVDNLVRSFHTDGVRATFNYYRKLSPTSMYVPGMEEWLNNNREYMEAAKARKRENKQYKDSLNSLDEPVTYDFDYNF